jgi:hypothetical protein
VTTLPESVFVLCSRLLVMPRFVSLQQSRHCHLLNFIGRGLLPKGAASQSKKQAIVPKLAWKSN